MQKEKINIENLLEQGHTIQIKPEGYSMYPMFLPGRDEAIIEKADPSTLKRGDVVLYRRTQGILVLHRICRREGDSFYLVGDNQSEIEGPLNAGQIRGKLTGFVRGGKTIFVRDFRYRCYSHIWLFLRPYRTVIKKPVAFIKKGWRKIRGKTTDLSERL